MTNKYCVEISANIHFGTAQKTFIWDICENINERLMKVTKPENPFPDTLLTKLGNTMTDRTLDYKTDALTQEEFNFRMNPNPVYLNNNLQIIANMQVDQIILFDFNGRKILTQKFIQQNTFSISMDPAQKAGLYMLQLKSNDHTLTKKLFILP